MAVIKAKPEKFIPYLFPLLERELLTPLLTTRVNMDDFKGAQGDTVTMRVGELRTVARKYEWRTRTAPIVLDDIQGGGGIPITLGSHAYSATGLTDEHFTMDEIDLVREVLQPQTEAVARDLEADVIAAYAALPTRETQDFVEGGANKEVSDPYFVAINARRKLLRQRRVTAGQLTWLVGTDVEAAILKSDRLARHDSAGDSNSSALRDATVGRIGGLNVVASADVDPGFSVVTASSSLVLGTVAPKAPRGAAMSQAAAKNGLAMRWLMDYDANFLRDRSIVSMFSGITEVFDEVFVGGAKDGQLKVEGDYTGVGDDVPKSARAVKINFTPAA